MNYAKIKPVRVRLITFLTLILSLSLATEACEKCSIAILKITNDNLNSLSSGIIENFLCTFDTSCKNNAEYSEWSNEMLLKVLYNVPDLFFEVLYKTHFDNIDLLLDEITTPVNDSLDIQKIYDKIKTVNVQNDMKEKFLTALEIAIKKQ